VPSYSSSSIASSDLIAEGQISLVLREELRSGGLHHLAWRHSRCRTDETIIQTEAAEFAGLGRPSIRKPYLTQWQKDNHSDAKASSMAANS
jgi:hypothetical protein